MYFYIPIQSFDLRIFYEGEKKKFYYGCEMIQALKNA